MGLDATLLQVIMLSHFHDFATSCVEHTQSCTGGTHRKVEAGWWRYVIKNNLLLLQGLPCDIHYMLSALLCSVQSSSSYPLIEITNNKQEPERVKHGKIGHG